MKFHFDQVQDLTGFATENKQGGETIKILTRDQLTSDNQDFYRYSEHISSVFLGKAGVLIDRVHQFLVIIHQDLSADLYVNDITISFEIQVKRDVKAGEAISKNDIADIRKAKFPNIKINKTDKVIYCFKVGWRFGLFFDLTPRSQPANVKHLIETENLNIEKMMYSIGDLYRYLSFYHVYKVLESDAQFEEMIQDGWFPFVEILSNEYKKLSELYQNKFDFNNRIKSITDVFTKERIQKITEKWWKNKIFSEKKSLIQAGVNAYLQDDQDGYVNCIKNLWTEMEGILRKLYHAETGIGDNVKSYDLIKYIVKKAKDKSGSDYSLLLPLPFLKYLQDVIFKNFNLQEGQIDMSRHTSSHGVADAEQYTKARALQLILILNQIYYYH